MRLFARCAAVALLMAGLAEAAPPDRLLAKTHAIIREHPEMWAGASIVRGRNVIAVGGRRTLVRDLAARADRASRRVGRIWGPVDTVILIPATTEQAAVLALPAHVNGLAAVAGVDRVIVEPSGFARLSGTGRQVVLTHELTHVATGAATSGDMPVWLVEGFADYVGYLGSGLPVRTVAAELAAEVRAGAPPRELPGRAAFQPGSVRLAQAYEEAWLACHFIADRFGERRLVALYRAALHGDSTTALVRTLGMDTSAFTEAWRDYVLRELS